jgi:hypothetical protein
MMRRSVTATSVFAAALSLAVAQLLLCSADDRRKWTEGIELVREAEDTESFTLIEEPSQDAKVRLEIQLFAGRRWLDGRRQPGPRHRRRTFSRASHGRSWPPDDPGPDHVVPHARAAVDLLLLHSADHTRTTT